MYAFINIVMLRFRLSYQKKTFPYFGKECSYFRILAAAAGFISISGFQLFL